MGLTLTGRYTLLFLTLKLASLLLSVSAEGTCDTIYKGFSDCLLSLGENMLNYPQELEERESLQTICAYWDDFHSCAMTAIADCQEGAEEIWEQLKKQSRNLSFQGSLFELCAGDNGVSTTSLSVERTVLLATFPMLVAWVAL